MEMDSENVIILVYIVVILLFKIQGVYIWVVCFDGCIWNINWRLGIGFDILFIIIFSNFVDMFVDVIDFFNFKIDVFFVFQNIIFIFV